jgi:hypothetical protein
VIIRPERLSVEGQEPAFVYVIMHNINKKYKHRCVQTDHDE